METASTKNDRILSVLGGAMGAWALLTAFDIGSSSQGDSSVAWLGVLCGLSFIGFCMACLRSNPQRSTRVLAVACLGCSLVFLPGPAMESPFLAALFSVLRSGLVLAGFAAMLHFLLLFPEPGPYAAQASNIRVLYVPAFLFWLLVSYRAVFTSDTEGALDTFTYVLTGLVMAVYFLMGLIIFLRRYIRTPVAERGPGGLRLMMWGSILGFAPALIGFLPPFAGLPGNQYYFVSMALLPLFWTRAAVRAS